MRNVQVAKKPQGCGGGTAGIGSARGEQRIERAEGFGVVVVVMMCRKKKKYGNGLD